jgi:hypothetical protein
VTGSSDPRHAAAIGELVFYQAADGAVTLDVRMEQDSLWLTQKQMSELFSTERSVVTKHLRNIFATGELVKESVSAFFAHTAADNGLAGTLGAVMQTFDGRELYLGLEEKAGPPAVFSGQKSRIRRRQQAHRRSAVPLVPRAQWSARHG